MPTIDEPSNARSRRTRAALLDAARAILERESYDALTMSAIAERAGVTRRAVYLHFDSRADLLGQLFDHIAATHDLHASVAPVWEAPDALTALDRWARHLAAYHPRLLAVDRAIREAEDRDADAARHRRRINAAQRQSCERLATRLAQEDQLAPRWDPESAGDMLFALVSTDLIERLLRTCGWNETQLAHGLSRLFRSGLVAAPG